MYDFELKKKKMKNRIVLKIANVGHSGIEFKRKRQRNFLFAKAQCTLIVNINILTIGFSKSHCVTKLGNMNLTR